MIGDRWFIVAVGGGALCACAALAGGAFATLPGDAGSSAAGRAVELVALCFGMVGALSGVAQVRRMLALGEADDVSLGFLRMLLCSFLAWLAYGTVLHNWVMLLVNSIGVAVTLTTLALAMRLQSRARVRRASRANEVV